MKIDNCLCKFFSSLMNNPKPINSDENITMMNSQKNWPFILHEKLTIEDELNNCIVLEELPSELGLSIEVLDNHP